MKRSPQLGGERFADAAGDAPGGMDFAAAEPFDDFLAELTEADALAAAEIGMLGDEAEDIAGGGSGVPAEQEVGAAQVKEAQGMRLQDLAQVHHAPQLQGSGGDLNGQEHVARFRGGEDMADGTDAADAGAEAGHFLKRPALAKPLEAAKLGDVKAGVAHFVLFVEEDADLGVAFDPAHGVDDDALGHGMGLLIYPNFRSVHASSGVFPSTRASRAARIVFADGGQPGKK